MLFLNSVRSAKQYPIQFSKIQSYDGIGSPSATLTGQIPFGPGAVNPIYSLQPQLAVKSNVSKITIVDLNTQEAQAALKKQIKPNEFRYYQLMSGFRRSDLIETLLIEEYRLSNDIFLKLQRNAHNKCKPDGCAALSYYRERCGEQDIGVTSPPLIIKGKYPHTVRIIRNKVESECQYLGFRAFIDMLGASGMIFYAKESEKPDQKKGSISKTAGRYVSIDIQNTNSSEANKNQDNAKSEYKVSFSNLEIMRALGDEQCKNTEKTGIICFDLVFRSPERVVRYLGEIISVENFSDKRFSPYLFYDKNTRFEIFKVNRGSNFLNGAALKVTDGEGDTFYVSTPDRADPGHHRTLETLSFVSDLINGAVSTKDLPQVTSFTISAQQ